VHGGAGRGICKQRTLWVDDYECWSDAEHKRLMELLQVNERRHREKPREK